MRTAIVDTDSDTETLNPDTAVGSVEHLKLSHLEKIESEKSITPSTSDVLYTLLWFDHNLGMDLSREENDELVDEMKLLNKDGKCPAFDDSLFDHIQEAMMTPDEYENQLTNKDHEHNIRMILKDRFMDHLKQTYSLTDTEVLRLHELAYYSSTNAAKDSIRNFGKVHLFDEGFAHVAELTNLVVSERASEVALGTEPGAYTRVEHKASEAFSRLSENDYLFSLAPSDGSIEFDDEPDLLTEEFYLDLQNVESLLETIQTSPGSVTKEQLKEKLIALKNNQSEFNLESLITRFVTLAGLNDDIIPDTVLTEMLKPENHKSLSKAFHEALDNWTEKTYKLSTFEGGETLQDYYTWNLSSSPEKHTVPDFGKVFRHKLGLEHYFRALGEALKDLFRRDPSLDKPDITPPEDYPYDINKNLDDSPRDMLGYTLKRNEHLDSLPHLTNGASSVTKAELASFQSQIIQMDRALADFKERSHFDARPNNANLLQGIKNFDEIDPGFSSEVLDNFSEYTGLDRDVAHLFLTHPDYHSAFVQAYHDKIDGWVFSKYHLTPDEYKALDYNIYSQKKTHGTVLDQIEADNDSDYGRHTRHKDGPLAFFLALETTLKAIPRFQLPVLPIFSDSDDGSMGGVD